MAAACKHTGLTPCTSTHTSESLKATVNLSAFLGEMGEGATRHTGSSQVLMEPTVSQKKHNYLRKNSDNKSTCRSDSRLFKTPWPRAAHCVVSKWSIVAGRTADG